METSLAFRSELLLFLQIYDLRLNNQLHPMKQSILVGIEKPSDTGEPSRYVF